MRSKKVNYNLPFILSLCTIIAFTVLSIVFLNMMQTERRWVEHRRVMEGELDGLLAALYEMEAVQRGYYITGNPDTRQHFSDAEKLAVQHLSAARLLANDIPEQEKRLDTLESLFGQRRQLLQYGFNTYSASPNKTLNGIVLQGDSLTNHIRLMVDAMNGYEQMHVNRRSKNINLFDLSSFFIVVCFGAIAALIIVFGFRTLKKENRKKEAAEREKMQAAEALQLSELIYKNLNDSSNDAIIIADENGIIISWNKIAADIFGYTEAEVAGQNVYIIMPEKYRAEHKAGIKRFLATGKSHLVGSRMEMEGKHKSGREFPIEITLSHWKLDSKHFFSASIRDITLQKRAQEKLNAALEELKRSNEELEQFAYIASHDLQEPLRKIRAFGGRLAARYDESAEIQGKEYVVRMVDAAERMQCLIIDLLSFSTVSRDIGDKTKVDLGKILKIVLDDLQVAITEAGAQIEYDDLPVLNIANPTQMQQLFQNLLSNAIKFRKKDVSPEIKIQCRTIQGRAIEYNEIQAVKNKTYYEIKITDNGIGFDNKYNDKIFTIFQRLHGRSEYKGTGIGLALCRKICANHGGFITARSDNGATFVVILPK